jgi:hypothetical protein
MTRLALLLVVLGACDPFWGANVQLRDPAGQPIENATLAVGCLEGSLYSTARMAVHSDHLGAAHVGGLGSNFPVGCDVYVAKPGFRTQRIRYRDICPGGPTACDRVFQFDLVLEPES